jgi:hypothetical protein
MSLIKKKESRKLHQFLLTFFNQETDHYEEKEINGFWIIKQKNNDNDTWQVAIYTKESFNNYKNYGKKRN